jgi:hypothetical protein
MSNDLVVVGGEQSQSNNCVQVQVWDGLAGGSAGLYTIAKPLPKFKPTNLRSAPRDLRSLISVVYIIALCSSINTITFCFLHVCSDTLRVCRVLAGSSHQHAIVCEFTDLPLMLLFEYRMLHKVQVRCSMGLLGALFVAVVYTSFEGDTKLIEIDGEDFSNID